jgi:ferric-dicitrate binding protein FerR (iron transport regulator)
MKMNENQIIEFILGQSDPEKKAEILEWINSSDENREEYYYLKNLVALTGETPGNEQRSEKELNVLLNKLSDTRKAKQLRMFINVSKYAAAIIVTFFIARFLIPSHTPNLSKDSWFEVSTASGQTAEMTLPDGTKVWMNALTHLKYPADYSASNREVSISGEAFFKVTHDEKSPFLVHTDTYNIKVLGTSFNVSSYPNDQQSKTTLVEGKVVLLDLNNKQIETLAPGQLFAFNTDNKSFQVSNVSTNYYTSWKDGYFAFDSEKLESIAAKLERIYAVKINIPEERIKKLSFSGTIMKNKPIEQILKIIELTAPVEFIIDRNSDREDRITILARK